MSADDDIFIRSSATSDDVATIAAELLRLDIEADLPQLSRDVLGCINGPLKAGPAPLAPRVCQPIHVGAQLVGLYRGNRQESEYQRNDKKKGLTVSQRITPMERRRLDCSAASPSSPIV